MNSRARNLSIVPTMVAPPPGPWRIALTLVLSSGAVGTGLGLLTLLVAPLVLALPGVTAIGVVRLALAQALVAWAALLLATAVTVLRMAPIYYTLRAGTRVSVHRSPPPSRAVAAAFRAPGRVVWGVTLAVLSVVIADAFGWIAVSGLSGWPRLAVALFAVSISCAGLPPTMLLWRMVLWRWLGRLHPDDVPAYRPRHLARRLAMTAALPVGTVGVSAVVVMLSHLIAFRFERRVPVSLVPSPWWTEPVAPLCAAGIALAATLATWWLVHRLGARSAADLSRLTGEIERLQRRGRPSTRAQLAVFELIPTTAAGAALGRALAELAGRFSDMAEKEQQAARAMEGVRHLRTQFLASMSHDLRSPLNTIVGFADLVASGAEGPITEEQGESVQMIHRSARDLLRLVNHILDWARLDAGRFEVAPLQLNVADMLDEVVHEAREILGDTPAQLHVEVDAELETLELHVDRRRIVEALLAVLEHSASMQEKGHIWMRAGLAPSRDHRGTELRITVQDDGPGVHPWATDRVFQAFREIQDPSGKRIGGLGVGLAVAREVVRAHDGSLTLRAEPRRGSTFTLTLPLPEAHTRPPRTKTLPPPVG